MQKFIFRGRTRGFSRRLRRSIRLSRWALALEHAARAFWPLLTALGFLAALALFGVFQMLDPLTHQIVLVVTGLVLLGTIAIGLFRMRLPDDTQAAARLDRDDPARPLETLTDTLAAGRDTAPAEVLWRAHVERAARAAERLKPSPPDLRLARYDVWALRLLALVLLIGALIGVGPDWPDRLRSIFEPGRIPGLAAVAPRADPAAEAWVTPPAYTGSDTIYLGELEPGEAVPDLPEGSEITIRVTDFDGTPQLEGDALEGVEAFTTFGGGLAEARGLLRRSGSLRVLAEGDVLADWSFTVIPDDPPTIALTEPPARAATGALDVRFEAKDDHGIVAAWAEIVPAEGLEPGRGMVDEPITFALPLPISGSTTEIADSAIRDLTDHPWAGAEVEMVLIAEDGAEQQGRSDPVRFVLPQRRFLNPLARALVEQRRELALDFEQGERVLDVLQAVTRRPEEIFEGNHGAYMGSRTAIRRLAYAVFMSLVPDAAPDVTELLWLSALALEEGDLSDALARLRQAEQRLREALESGTEEDIRQALDELRQAMNDYLEEMVRQAMQNPPQPGQQMPPGQQLSQQDLQEMLDEIQRQAESGLRDQARDMLSQLSRMLESLQAGNPQMQQGQGPGQQALRELQELIQRQRDLADDTFDQLRQQRRGQQGGQQGEQQGQDQGQGQSGQQGRMGEGQMGQGDGSGQAQQGGRLGPDGQPLPGQDGQPGSLAEQQQALREALDALRQQLQGLGQGGNGEDPLGEAGREMGEATDDLRLGQNGDAVQDQMEALDRLNEGANQLAQQIQNGQGQQGAEGQGMGMEGRASDQLLADPFDRPAGAYGAIDGRDTDVPDRSALDRAREVLEELRRRSAEPGRQQLELDYFDRLMDQF